MRHLDVGMEMVRFPDMQNWTTWDLVLVFLMWAIIMVGMMVPAASPVILLFAEINRRRNGHQSTFVSAGQFLLGYRRRGRALASSKESLTGCPPTVPPSRVRSAPLDAEH
jgi:predicted metal-binding membrane protein